MQAVWNYASARRGETGIMISGKLNDVVKLADWFSKYNIVIKRGTPILLNKKYQLYMTFDSKQFVAPKKSQKPNNLVDTSDLFESLPSRIECQNE